MKRAHRFGFTLIELLVVIAIIAILAAILFPVFAQAREKARQTACLSNQKQIATALLIYAPDYDETFPGWMDIPSHPLYANYSWAIIVPVMDSYLKNRQVWHCPSAALKNATASLPGPTNDKIVMDLGYNEYIYNIDHKDHGNPISPRYDPGWNKLAKLASSNAGVSSVALMTDALATDPPASYMTGRTTTASSFPAKIQLRAGPREILQRLDGNESRQTQCAAPPGIRRELHFR